MGLAMARRLAHSGQRVTILESRPNIGGLADAWQLGDVLWDRHYHVTLLSDTVLREWLDDLGLADEMKWVETKTSFYTGGKFYSMSSTWEFLNFPPLNLIEKLRLGATIFLASKIKNWRRMEQLTVEKWLRRWSGTSTFDKIWLPLLRAKLGDAYQRTSAAFIWSYIRRMYKARRTGHKREMFGYVPGGYARILDAISADLQSNGVSIELGRRISRVASRAGDNKISVRFEEGNTESFDGVVMTTNSQVVARLCSDLSDDQKRRHNGVEYLSIVCASILLKKPLRGYYVTNITDDVPFTAVIEMSTIVSPEELNGNTLVYLPKYATQDDPVLQMSDDEVREEFLAAFLAMYPAIVAMDIKAFRISRVRHVMAIPTLNYSQTLPAIRASPKNLFVVNSAQILQGTLNVNETITLANDAFESVIAPMLKRPA